jgi:hypothetical protein
MVAAQFVRCFVQGFLVSGSSELNRNHAEELPRITQMNANATGNRQPDCASNGIRRLVEKETMPFLFVWIRVIRGQLNCSG